jgi:hypothetical protein
MMKERPGDRLMKQSDNLHAHEELMGKQLQLKNRAPVVLTENRTGQKMQDRTKGKPTARSEQEQHLQAEIQFFH